MFFAELGAEVVKIENAGTGGDITRGWRLPGEAADAPVSAYFCSVNWHKKHLLLDLACPDFAKSGYSPDRALALEYCRAADIVISNFKPSSARRLGFDAESLRTENQRLIYAQLNAWADPEDESPAFDVVLQAEAGFLGMCGEPGRPPVKMPVALIDLLAAHQLKEGILLALLERERTGRGATVTTSLFGAAVASLANQATNWLMAGHVPGPLGTRHPNIAPYGDVFPGADGRPVLLAVGTERQWRQLCRVLGLEKWAEHADFQSNTTRVSNRERLCEILKNEILKRPAAALVDELKATGVPAALIRSMPEVFELPAAQGMILEEALAGGFETRRVKTVAFEVTA